MSKLVRDKIPSLTGPSAKYHVAEEDEYKKALATKLIEEATEFALAPSQEELADVLEVVSAIVRAYEWPMIDVSRVRMEKADKRGKFDLKLILDDPV